jgi:hypothetical protein
VLVISLINTTIAMPTDQGPLTITIKEKWTKVINERGLYLFSDTNDNVYSIQDTFWHLDYSSANRYAMIECGSTYRIWLFGVRMPFFSLYENAYRIEKI